MNGTNQKFRDLKPRLIAWYQGERLSSRRRAEKEFDKARLSFGDSTSIFALKLEQLAERAFPASRYERERQLVKKFWEVAPREFTKVMSDAQRNLLLSTGKKNLTWEAIKRLAESDDRLKKFSVGGSNPSSSDDGSTVRPGRWGDACNRSPNQRSPPRTIYNSRFQRTINVVSQDRQGTRTAPRCHWCGRSGHTESSCWEKRGCCMACGSPRHSREECHKYDEERVLFRPVCSKCGGEHLGKQCPTPDRQLN
jgi:hypothetical protein